MKLNLATLLGDDLGPEVVGVLCPVCERVAPLNSVCHGCVRLEAKSQERDEIVAWLRVAIAVIPSGRHLDLLRTWAESVARVIERRAFRRDDDDEREPHWTEEGDLL
jgi:hypothetical protein